MRGKVALLVAIVLGAAAAWGVYSYLQGEKIKYQQKVKMREVVGAKEWIKRGTEVEYDMLMPIEIPERAISADHIMWRDAYRLVRSTLDRNVERGEPILWSYRREVRHEVTTTLPTGYVALALRVDEVSGVAGTIRPGSQVDVLASLPAAVEGGGGATEQMTTKRLLTHCTVLAVDNRTGATQPAYLPGGRGAMGYSTVTLAVKPVEASLLVFVQDQGRIVLTLRNPADAPSEQEPPEVTLQNVWQVAEQANQARKERQREMVGAGLPESP